MASVESAALEKFLLAEEYNSLSEPVRKKINEALQDQTDECACIAALHESEKQKNGDLIATLKKDVDAYKGELESTKEKLELVESANSALTSKVKIQEKKLEDCELSKRNVEKCLDELRHERDTSQFTANALQSALDLKDAQLSQLKTDIEVLRGELDSAVESKFQALVNQDEVEVKGKELELKEVQLDKEKARMQKRVDALNAELDKKNKETIELSKESNTTFLELQVKLQTQTTELTALQEKYERLLTVYKEREKEAKELSDKLTGQAQDEIDYRVHLEAQLNAQKEFAQAHKDALTIAKQKCQDMEATLLEIKTKLDKANSKQAELEGENEDLKRELKERVDHFNEQMKAADDMLFAVKSDNLEKSLETLSPYAVEVSKRLREGLTYTDVIKLYATASEELVVKQGIIDSLQADMHKIMEELKDVAPRMRRKCDRLHEALQVIDQLTVTKEKMDHEKVLLEEAYKAERSKYEVVKRENDRNQAYVKDLCKQLCLFLKKEAEERGIPVPVTDESVHRSPNKERRASLDLNSLVENRLLTYSCFEELQQRNLELLETVRILKQELEQALSNQSGVGKHVEQTEALAELEARLQQMRDQNETQKQHLKYLMILLRQNPEGIEYNEDFQSFSARTKVSATVQTEESSLKYTVKDFQALEADLAATTTRLEGRISSLLATETQLRVDLRKSEAEANELKIKARKLVSDNEYKEEMMTTLRHNAEISAAQIAALEKSNASFRESVLKNEAIVRSLHQQVTTLSKQLINAEMSAERDHEEIDRLKAEVRDLSNARESFARDKSLHTKLMTQIEAMWTQMTLSEQVGKARLESKLEDALKEVNGLRHKLTEEASRYSSKLELLQRNLDTTKNRLNEEMAAKESVRAELDKTRMEMKTISTELDSMKAQMEVAKKSSQNESEISKQLDSVKGDLLKTQSELKEAQNLVAVTKANEKSIQEICATFEKHNKDLLEKVKNTQTTYDAKVAELSSQVSSLSSQLKSAEGKLAAHCISSASAPVLSDSGSESNEVVTLKLQVEGLRQQLRESERDREKAQADYVRELQRHAVESDSVPRLTDALAATRCELQTVQKDKVALESKVAVYERQLSVRQGDLDAEKAQVRQELEEVRAQNETLYKALDELSSQCNQSLNAMENSSLSCDEELRGNENVISVIKTLRQQCSLARIDKQQVECEVRVLRSDKDMLSRKLTESNALLSAERDRNVTNKKTLEKHAELVQKIEMMELVTDSNRILREDIVKLRDQLETQAKEKETYDSRVVEPLKAKISTLLQDLEVKTQQIEHLRKQSEMWKKRSDELVEKLNKSNPEDIKRLNLEKETLSKQLVSERDSYRSNLEELKALRTETNTQKEQLIALNKQVDELKSTSAELSKVQTELESARAELASLSAIKTELVSAKSQLDTVQKDVVAKAQLIDNLKKLARRYKTQFEETSKTLEDEKASKASEKEEDAALVAQLKEKDELIAKYESEKAMHESEINDVKTSTMQREERMKEVLRKCKQKMATQVLEINQLKKSGGGIAGTSASKVAGPSAQELEEMERTIAELREERDKLTRDNEVMLQKNNMLTRHLNVQSTSSSESAKTPPEAPPTANIKPTMSGAVTPWRERETRDTQPVNPFVASVRPMLSSEPRLVVVAPTNLLEPPSSSSSGPRQATILPNIPSVSQAMASPVPNTEEVELPDLEQQNQQQGSSSNPSASAASTAASIVALVLPQERNEMQPASQQVTGSQSTQQTVTGSQTAPAVTGSQVTSPVVTGSQVQQIVTGSQSGQQVVTGSQNNNQSVVTESRNQQVVTGSQAPALVSAGSSSNNNQQQVSGSQTSPQVTGSTASGSQLVTAGSGSQLVAAGSGSQIVTGSNQGDEAVAGPSQQYVGELPCTSTSQQLTDNSSNTVTTSRGNLKRVRDSEGVADSLLIAETTEDDEEGRNKRRRVLLEVEYQVPTSSQRDQEDEILVPDSDEEEDGCEEGGGEVEENEEDMEEEEEAGDEDMEEGERHVYEHEPDGVDFDEVGVRAPHNSSEPSSSQPPSYEEGGDGIVPSTPTLYIPRPSHAVSSPHVPSGRFTFSSDVTPLGVGGEVGGAMPVDMTTDPSHSVPEQANVALEIIDDPVDVTSEGEGREAEAVPPICGGQRIQPLVSTRRGRGGRGQRVTPQPIVWEEDGARGRGGYTRGTPRGGRRARGFPGAASSSSFNRFLP